MKTSILLLIGFACMGCTCREISYRGVKYSHKSWLVSQAFGELAVKITTNDTAEVTLKNFSNDQVSALREAKEILVEANKLKSP